MVSKLTQVKVQETALFFRNLPLFHYLSKESLEMVASRVQLRKFVTNTLILRQDDLPRSIYFVKTGRIKVLRKVEFKIPENQKQAESIQDLIQDPSLDEYGEGKVESKLLEIDELSCGDLFAEYASILREPIQYSVVTAIPSEVYHLHVDDFCRLGKEFAEAMLRFSKAVPSDRDLRRAFIEMNRWTQYKSSLTKSIKAESYNRKNP